MSVTSSKSKGPAYRTLSKTSSVDDSLFGKPGKKKGGAAEPTASLPSFLQQEQDSVVLSASEISRMRQPTSFLTADEIASIKREAQAKKDSERAVSDARKEKMLRREVERKKHVPLTETEQLKVDSDNSTRTKAAAMLEEELDDVKRMNQMMLYSKCVTIRDAQIEEKKFLQEEQEEEDRRLDLMMEIERIQALEAYEEREKKRAEDRRKGADILKRQIEERAQERQRQEELRDMDRRQMLDEIDRMKEEEMRQLQEKRAAGRKLLEEVAKANLQQIDRKKLILVAEKEEDARIAAYIQEKEAREAAAAEEADRVKKERELEVARLRAQQEKANDRQAEMDELRAMRAQETYEREWREKERAEMARLAAINEDLARAREQQKMVKMKQLADQAKMEQEEFFRIIDAQQQKEQEDMLLAQQQAAVRSRHKEEILNQIADNEEVKRRERREYLEEGRRLRQKHQEERNKLITIKGRKLKELEKDGVPAKYRAELARKKI